MIEDLAVCGIIAEFVIRGILTRNQKIHLDEFRREYELSTGSPCPFNSGQQIRKFLSNGRSNEKTVQESTKNAEHNEVMSSNHHVEKQSNKPRTTCRNVRTDENNNQRKMRLPTISKLKDFELVGDDFLLSVGINKLGGTYENVRGVRTSGLCSSGLTIRKAAEKLSKVSDRRIILNIGTVDILQMHSLHQLEQDYLHLLNICAKRNIQVVVTTLAPIANMQYDKERMLIFKNFNHFLMKLRLKDYIVVELMSAFLTKNGKVRFECYRSFTKKISGSNRSQVLWSSCGEAIVLAKLLENLYSKKNPFNRMN